MLCVDVAHPCSCLMLSRAQIVCATGFDSSYRPRYPLIGRDGRSLAEDWASHPEAYLGCMVNGERGAHTFSMRPLKAEPGYPNMFVYGGPGSPTGCAYLAARCVLSGSPPHPSRIPIQIELGSNFFELMIKRMLVRNIKSFEPTAEAQQDFNEWAQRRYKVCSSTHAHDPCLSGAGHGLDRRMPLLVCVPVVVRAAARDVPQTRIIRRTASMFRGLDRPRTMPSSCRRLTRPTLRGRAARAIASTTWVRVCWLPRSAARPKSTLHRICVSVGSRSCTWSLLYYTCGP